MKNVQTFSNLAPNFTSSQSRWAAKSCSRRILLQFLNFRPKIQVFCKKKRSSPIFSIQIFNFRPKIKAISRKKGLQLEFHSYLLISAPNMLQQSRKTRLRNFHYCQKTGNIHGAASES